MPSKEKKKYMALNSSASPTEVANAESEIFKWQQATVKIDERLKTNSARASQDLLRMENASEIPSYSSPYIEHLPKSQIAKLSEARVFAKYDSLSSFQRERRAELERRKGNEYFKSSDYDLAVKHYTISIALRDEQDAIWANRAIAYIKLKLFDLAETDCNVALRINPSSLKALQRRGFARFNLGRYRDAAMDYAFAIELDGGVSEDYRAMLQKTLDKYEETEGKPLDLAAVLSASLAPAPSHSATQAKFTPAQQTNAQQTRSLSSKVEAGWTSYSSSVTRSLDQLAIPKESVKLVSKGIVASVPKPLPAVVEKETFVQIPIQFDDDDDEDEEKQPVEESKKGDEGFIRIPIITDDEEDDDDEPQQSNSSQSQQYREVEAAAGISPNHPSDQAANVLKEHGNQLMLKGNYQQALTSYNASLARQPGNVAVLNNRAQAKLSLRDFEGAAEDSTAVLQAEPSNVKALYRRAKAKSELKEWLAAADDLKSILVKDSANAAAKKLLVELEPQLRSSEAEKLKNDGNTASHAGDFKQAAVLYTQALKLDEDNLAARSNRSLAHLKLQDFAAAEADASDVLRRLASNTSSEMNSIHSKVLYRRAEARYQLALQSHANGKLSINEEESLLKQALDDLSILTALDPSNKAAPTLHGLIIASLAESKERNAAKKSVPSPSASNQLKKEPVTVLKPPSPLLPKASESESMFSAVKTTRKSSSTESAAAVISPEKAANDVALPSPPPATQPRSTEKQPSSALKSEKSFKNLTATELPSAPAKTLYEFERVWRGLQGQPSLQLGYLTLFKAANFKKVFKAAISDDLLGSLFTSLTQPTAEPALVLRVLESLKQMNSFSLTISMLPAEHLQELGRVVDGTKARVSVDGETMDRLKQLEVEYGLRK